MANKTPLVMNGGFPQQLQSGDSLSAPSFTISSMIEMDSGTLTTAATTANQVLDLSPIATIRTAKYIVQVTSGTAYYSTEIMLSHNGTVAYISDSNSIGSNLLLAGFTCDISGGNLRLLTTPLNAVTVYKFFATKIVL